MKPLRGIILFIIVSTQQLYAQVTYNQDHIEPHFNNCIGLFSGISTITQTQFQIPTIGFEYFHFISPRMGIGCMTEFEMGTHIWELNEEGDKVAEVKRGCGNNFVPTIYCKVYKGLKLYTGYGIQIEENNSFGIYKLGLCYKLRMHNHRWLVIPSTNWGHTKYYDGLVYGVVFAYQWGGVEEHQKH